YTTLFRSINPPGDERAVAELLAGRLKGLGIPDVEIVAEVPERPNVIARLPGHGGWPALLFNGHIDTKPVGDQSKWRTDPLVPTIKDDGYIYGLGTADMKGAVAAMCFAASALAAASTRPAGDLILAFTADEEAGSRYGAQFLVQKQGLKADACLIGEPSGLTEQWEYLVLVSRGISAFRTRVRGTQMHASASNIVPCVNASTKMAQVMVRMANDLQVRHQPHPLLPKGPTINIGMRVESGVFYGILPALGEFTSDVRVQPGMSFEQVKADVEGFVQRLRDDDPELDIEVEFEEGPLRWIEPTEVSADEPIVKAAQWAVRQVLGAVPPFGACPGWTDSRWTQGEGGVPTIPAFGPGLLTVCHGPNERVPVEGIVQAAKIYALTAARFLG
ncbi:MAG: M20 family metallopeptidase, partial [Chloroflexi bacterium]|nr:M20 family metallopeptidase [Chloroflexota bacterium]